jgi:hypothetical protein
LELNITFTLRYGLYAVFYGLRDREADLSFMGRPDLAAGVSDSTA